MGIADHSQFPVKGHLRTYSLQANPGRYIRISRPGGIKRFATFDSTMKRKKKIATRHIKRLTISSRKQRPVRRKGVGVKGNRKSITDPRVARALGYMRRDGASASNAARRERMKLKTFRRGAGRYLYRSGPGKPWKARSEDELRFSMTILTSRGPVEVIVRNSRERKLLHQYELALRMFRAGEDGAEAALKKFKGKKVGGQTLVTNIDLLIELEEAGQLDFDAFYTAIGSRS